jgi:ADP-ribose pyrophosphatase
LKQTEILKTYPFRIDELTVHDQIRDTGPHTFHRIRCPDWVNILPITSDGKAILIRQCRVGSMSDVLETPGGVIDEADKDPTITAQRELEEETGYTSGRLLFLGKINPNPAIMSNNLHMFLAMNCQPVRNRKHFPDEHELIKVETVPLQDLDMLVRTGAIGHALCALTIMLSKKYWPS